MDENQNQIEMKFNQDPLDFQVVNSGTLNANAMPSFVEDLFCE